MQNAICIQKFNWDWDGVDDEQEKNILFSPFFPTSHIPLACALAFATHFLSQLSSSVPLSQVSTRREYQNKQKRKNNCTDKNRQLKRSPAPAKTALALCAKQFWSSVNSPFRWFVCLMTWENRWCARRVPFREDYVVIGCVCKQKFNVK